MVKCPTLLRNVVPAPLIVPSQETSRPQHRRTPLQSRIRNLGLLRLRPPEFPLPIRPILRRPLPRRRAQSQPHHLLPRLSCRPLPSFSVRWLEGLVLVHA